MRFPLEKTGGQYTFLHRLCRVVWLLEQPKASPVDDAVVPLEQLACVQSHQGP